MKMEGICKMWNVKVDRDKTDQKMTYITIKLSSIEIIDKKWATWRFN